MLDALLGRKFWILAALALACGFWLPGDYRAWRITTTPLLGSILLFSCLNLPLQSLRDNLREPGWTARIATLTALKLIAAPIGAWALTLAIAPTWAPGILLVSAMPAGLSSIAFSELYEGNRVTALFLVAVTSLFAPASVPVLLGTLGSGSAHLDPTVLAERALYILLVIAAPFFLAQAVRAIAPDFVERRPAWWRRAAILSSCLLGFVAVAAHRASWSGWPPVSFVTPLALACLASLVFVAVSWAAGRRLARADAIAFACGTVYVNNGLAILLAVRFFPGDGRALLPAVLIQLPMVAAVTRVQRTATAERSR